MPLPERLLKRVGRRIGRPLLLLIVIHILGTIGYMIIGGPKYSALDCLYMTFITIATIGYGEVVDVSLSPVGRVFTMAIGWSGIATTWYMMSMITAFIVEGEINVALRRKGMLNTIAKLRGHYIVCGIGRVGNNVARELEATGRRYVIIDVSQAKIDAWREHFPDAYYIHGDGSDDAMLAQAGLQHAAGVFAITGDDAKNLVITLSAKQAHPAVRVVARCHEVGYIDKIRRVGADDIVSPDFTGGMRIASAMVRPHVVNFLDEMLRSDRSLRVEEITVRRNGGSRLGDLELKSREHILLAVRGPSGTEFNPADDVSVAAGDVLVVMATPAGRAALESRFA